MTEVWLHSNRRVLLLAMIPAGLLGAAGWSLLSNTTSLLGAGLAWGVVAIAIGLVARLSLRLLRPRVAYRDGQVLFFLRAGPPIEVPLQVVEAFFLGQGPAHLLGGVSSDVEAVNLVARLSQRELQWKQIEVQPRLGSWCDSYVTIRGTWCEPLTGSVIGRLNRRLGELSRADREKEGGASE